MTVYFDGVHLMCKDLDVLHATAQMAGLKRCWFQNHPRHPHYDVLSTRIIRNLVNSGVKLVTSRGLLIAMDKK